MSKVCLERQYKSFGFHFQGVSSSLYSKQFSLSHVIPLLASDISSKSVPMRPISSSPRNQTPPQLITSSPSTSSTSSRVPNGLEGLLEPTCWKTSSNVLVPRKRPLVVIGLIPVALQVERGEGCLEISWMRNAIMVE